MSKVFGRILLFFSFLILLVFASFFIAFNDSAFSQFFQASLISSQENLANSQEAFIAAQNKLPDFQIVVAKSEVVAPVLQESLEDKLDDIAEKIDIIARQVADLAGENSKSEALNQKQIQDPNDQNEEKDEDKKEKPKQERIQLVKQSTKNNGTKPAYPRILISEVKISDFVKLYNPNSEIINLTNWYLQRKTATGTSYASFATKSDFYGKKIGSNDYFLIGKEGRHTGSADMFLDEPITENNTFVLKNPNEEISDTYFVEPPPAEPEPESPAPAPLKNILITEIQIAGLSDDKDEFVELYNPNNLIVDLTGWYLQRKTASASSYSSYATSTLFSGKSIGSNDYFLIARTGYHTGSADMFVDNPLTENNSLVLRNQSRDIIDKVGWGDANDFETLPAPNPPSGQSIKRKWDELLETYQDTDNNFIDFIIFGY